MTTPYSIALFLHVVGALVLSAALTLEWAGLARLRRATTAEQVREWAWVWALLPRLGPIAWTALLFPGIYMMVVAWGREAWWIGFGFLGMALLAGLGGRSGRQLAGPARAASAESGPLAPALRGQLADSTLWRSVHLRVSIALGVVFLMTVKPGLAGSLLTVAVAVGIGLASPWSRRGHRPVFSRVRK